MSSDSSLVCWCTLIGCALSAFSVGGIALSLFLIFEDNVFYDAQLIQGTYTPSEEDVVPAMVVSVISLLINVMLVGASKLRSNNMLLVWTVWKVFVVILFWAWYGYNQLKFHSYIEWEGMKNCYFCGDQYTEQYVVMGGAIGSIVIVLCIVPVEMLRSKLKAIHREMTELLPTGSVQYLDRGNSGLANHQQLLTQSHPNFYPIQQHQPTWAGHQQMVMPNHTHQYLLQQQYEMQQNYNAPHQQGYKHPTAQQYQHNGYYY